MPAWKENTNFSHKNHRGLSMQNFAFKLLILLVIMPLGISGGWQFFTIVSIYSFQHATYSTIVLIRCMPLYFHYCMQITMCAVQYWAIESSLSYVFFPFSSVCHIFAILLINFKSFKNGSWLVAPIIQFSIILQISEAAKKISSSCLCFQSFLLVLAISLTHFVSSSIPSLD